MVGGRRIGRLASCVAGTVALVVVPGTLPGGIRIGATALPDLVEVTVSLPQRTVRAGGTLRVADAIRNRGASTAPPSTTGYYLSRDRIRGPGDRRLGGRSIGSVRPGAITPARVRVTVRIPASTAPGFYRVLACADDRDRIRESDELNNCRATARLLRVTRPVGDDRTPPAFAGLKRAVTCIPGPIDGDRKSSYHLDWDAATDNVTPSSKMVYDVYQATTPGGEDFSEPTYATAAGVTSFSTPALPAAKAYYFVVRARDRAGNRDPNRVERVGMNPCV